MIKLRRDQLKSAVEKELASGGFEEVFTADDFSDLDGGIVHDHGELIGRKIIVTPGDKITEVFAGDELARAVVGVGEGDYFAVGDKEAVVNPSWWLADS